MWSGRRSGSGRRWCLWAAVFRDARHTADGAGAISSFGDVGRPRVAIVNQAMARRYFPGEDPIGKRVAIDRNPKDGGWFGSDEPYEIIGVAGDAKAFELRDAPYPTIYFNMFQESRLSESIRAADHGQPGSGGGDGAADGAGGPEDGAGEAGHDAGGPGGLEHCSRAADRDALGVLRRPGRGAGRHRRYTDCWPTRWRGGRTRSASGWRWGPRRAA